MFQRLKKTLRLHWILVVIPRFHETMWADCLRWFLHWTAWWLWVSILWGLGSSFFLCTSRPVMSLKTQLELTLAITHWLLHRKNMQSWGRPHDFTFQNCSRYIFSLAKVFFLEDFCYAHCSFSQQFFFSFLWKGTCRAVYSKLCHRLRRTGWVATLLLSGEASTNPMVNLTSILRFYVQLDEI